MGWVMAWTTELRKYIHMHNTAKLLHMKERTCLVAEHTIGYKYIRHAGLSLDSLLLTWQEGLAGVIVLVITPFRKQDNFWQDICFNTCSQHQRISVNNVCRGHVNRKTSIYKICPAFTAGALTTRFQSVDKSTCSTPAWNEGISDERRQLFCSQTLTIVSSSRCLSGNDHMHLDYWL